MPIITLTWSQNIYTPRTVTPYANHPHIRVMELRDANNALMSPNIRGLYIIEVNNRPIYAGKAEDSIRGRFDIRGAALSNFGLDPAASLPNRTIRIATVNPAAAIEEAERWLIRYLYVQDQTRPVGQRRLTNVEKTPQYAAPADGLAINNVGNRPGYLPDDQVYAPGTAI